MAIIYHVTGLQDWETAQELGFYEAPSLLTEGFIHCSQEEQVEGVLQRYFAGRSDLVKLVIDTDMLDVPLRYEEAPSIQQVFPHIYGRLNLAAVIAALPARAEQ
jgi:uncharacterized protein (DUF952 family)